VPHLKLDKEFFVAVLNRDFLNPPNTGISVPGTNLTALPTSGTNTAFQVGGSFTSFTIENPGSSGAALSNFSISAKFSPTDGAWQTIASGTNIKFNGAPLIVDASNGLSTLGTNGAAYVIIRTSAIYQLELSAACSNTNGTNLNIRGMWSDN
jgi:hypothetical protein